MKVSVVEARNRFTKLLQAVENGERVTVCRHGKPIAGIVPTQEKKAPQFGTLKGEVIIHDPDWWKPQNDIDGWLRGDV